MATATTSNGDTHVQAWIDRLRDRDPNRRLQATMALFALGSGAREAVSELMLTLGDTYPQVRRMAASALGEIGPDAGAAVGALASLLRDRDEMVRRHAILALGEIRSTRAIPVLIRALRDISPLIRRTAAAALGEFGPAAPAAVPALVEALAEEDIKNRAVAGAALLRIGEMAVPMLLDVLDHDEPRVRRHAVTLLGKLEAVDAYPLIEILLDDPNEDVRTAAAEVLGCDIV